MGLTRLASLGLLGFLLLGLLLAPLPLGGARPWATAALSMGFCGLGAAAALLHLQRALRRGRERPGPPPAAWAVALLLMAFAGWVALQLSPWGHSEEPFETRVYALRAAGYAGLFVAALLLLNSHRRRALLLGTLVAAGVMESLLAVVLFAAQKPVMLFGTLLSTQGRATGTFPNFDHLANFLTLCLAAGIGLMLTQLGRSTRPPGRHWQQRLHAGLSFMLSAKMVLRLLLVLMVVALVLTRSRAGNGVFFAAVLLLGLWVFATSRQWRRPAALLVVSLLVVDVVVVGQWVGLDKVVKRLEATELALQQAEAASASTSASATADAAAPPGPAALPPSLRRPPPRREETLEERWYAARDALQLVLQRPWTGHGAGSFYVVFPGAKSEVFAGYPYRWDHAHSDYVEIAADTGLPGLALLAAVFLATFGRALALVTDRQPPQTRGVAAGVLMGLVCALFHSLVDFNLQIYANAMVLTVLSALVWSIPSGQNNPRQRPEDAARQR